MTLLAIVPAHRARYAFAVENGPTFSREIGTLEAVENEPGRTSRRIVTATDINGIVFVTMDAVRSSAVDRVVVDPQVGEYEARAAEIAEPVMAALLIAGVAVDVAPSSWRNDYRRAYGAPYAHVSGDEAASYAVSLLKFVLHSPAGDSSDFSREGKTVPAAAPADRSETRSNGIDNKDSALSLAAGDVHAATLADVMRGIPLVVDAIPPQQGRRIAGIDPGSRSIGVVVIEGERAPFRCIVARTFEVGRVVALEKPRVIKRADGSEHVLATKRELSDDDVEEVAVEIVDLLRECGVERLALEHTYGAHFSDASRASSRVTALLRAMWVSTTIGVLARVAGIAVERVAVATWRSQIVGKRVKGGGRDAIEPAIAARFSDWPRASDEHERDAAGLALYAAGVRKEIAPKAAKVPRAKRARPDVTTERRAARDAVGCECSSRGRHLMSCPLSLHQKRKRAAVEHDPSLSRTWL